MPSFELTDGVKACIEMAEAALGVKNIVSGAATASSVCTHCPGKCRESTCFCFMQALETLSGENDTLKKENSQLVNLATAKGVSYIVRKRVYASCCCWPLCLGICMVGCCLTRCCMPGINVACQLAYVLCNVGSTSVMYVPLMPHNAWHASGRLAPC